MVTADIYFVTTRMCNCECEHCYISASPRLMDTTIGREDFNRVIGHLPKVPTKLTLSGGELFAIKDTLYDFLEYLKHANMRRKQRDQGGINVAVQTNGSWARDDDKTKSILLDLASFGVKNIDIASDSVYHRRQGVKPENPKRLERLAKESKLFEYAKIRGSRRASIAPVGRGKDMNIRPGILEMGGSLGGRPGCVGSLDYYDVSIQPDGSVFQCCLLRGKLPGNVIQEPLVDIVRRARKDPRLKLLNDDGATGIALADGHNINDILRTQYRQRECGFCFKTYREDDFPQLPNS